MIASPRPSSGIGATAMRERRSGPGGREGRRDWLRPRRGRPGAQVAHRLACSAPSIRAGPNARSASPGSTDGVEPQRQPRRIVGRQHAWRSDRIARGARSSRIPSAASMASAASRPDAAGGAVAGERYDGRFQPHCAWAGIEDERDVVSELLDDMFGARRAEPAGTIGGRRGQRAAERRDRRHAQVRAAHAARWSQAPGRQWNGPAPPLQRHDDRERPRPELLREPLGARVEHSVAPGHGDVGDVADERIEARPALAAKILATASPFAASAARP